jgi:hypothetical protein
MSNALGACGHDWNKRTGGRYDVHEQELSRICISATERTDISDPELQTGERRSVQNCSCRISRERILTLIKVRFSRPARQMGVSWRSNADCHSIRYLLSPKLTRARALAGTARTMLRHRNALDLIPDRRDCSILLRHSARRCLMHRSPDV